MTEERTEGKFCLDEIGRRKILIVDDNRDTAAACASLFKAMGHDVQTAYDGVAALEMARTNKPEAIFLDIGLPGMNGYDVCKTLRTKGLPTTSSWRFLVMASPKTGNARKMPASTSTW